MANFGICGKIFDEICTFLTNDKWHFGGKILWAYCNVITESNFNCL